ncbi:unnamed protein product [Sphagnum jensenii]|uniref:VNS transcription factor n=1 Tax=Sphagnum jensenii TaxID=128206 RepID=A0ABP1BJD0_9BRYO
MSHSPPATRVPVGFRFHPTDEELVGYYLPKKVAAKPIDLDLIRELDLYKLEPWDLQEQCKIPDANEKQTDYYFFSRKDKKYPTGNRANRATTAGFWKATGRDKAIWTKVQQLIGMRKTLVFYEGRAPHGNKTDWIMHEFRLDDGPGMPAHDDGGWVVCRVFKKTKNFKMKTEERAVSYEGQFGLMPEIMSSPEILSGGGGAAASYHPGFGPNNNPSMVPSSAAYKGMKHTYHHHHHHNHHSRASSSVKDGRGETATNGNKGTSRREQQEGNNMDALVFLLHKELRPSDVSNLGRIVLPKKEAEYHLPFLQAREGMSLAMEDFDSGKIWTFRYRFWPNNKSRMYLLEITGDFVKAHNLQEGDLLILYRNALQGNYVVRGEKHIVLEGARKPNSVKAKSMQSQPDLLRGVE